MKRSLNQGTVEQISRRLAELLAVSADRLSVRRQASVPGDGAAGERADLVVWAGRFRFAVEWKASGQAAAVAMAIRSVCRFVEKSRDKLIPLVAAPYIGDVGRHLCEEAKVYWLDLSGNAHVVAPGLRVHIEGKPNRFKRPGRPRSVFAPKSARIARWLLINPQRAFTQRELAKAAGLDEGFTSRIVRQLEEQRLVTRGADGAVKVADYDAMLDGWREAYEFSKHHIVRGHIAARTSDDVLQQVAAHLKRGEVEHAVTGLAGAWLLRNWISERLKASLQHEYAQKLETHKAQLRSQSETHIARLKADLEIAAAERSFRFSHVFERTADTIATT